MILLVDWNINPNTEVDGSTTQNKELPA